MAVLTAIVGIFVSLGWLWHLSNEIHIRLGLGHWLVFSGLLSLLKLIYAGHRDNRAEMRERRARR